MNLISEDALLSIAKDITLANGAKHRCIDATQIYELPKTEIVNCKDCEFGKYCLNGKHELSVECHNPEKLVVEVHTPEWFCAYGWKDGGN